MGGSGSSLLDESKCTYIRGKTEAVIKNFSPHYKRQYAVSFCKNIQNELEQNRDLQSHFLKTKPPADSSMVFYEGEVSHFAEDVKKWKDRYIVVNSKYAVESFENKEAFQKGNSPKSCILPVGGKVLTTEEEYNLLSDKHFPDPSGSNEKENAQAFVGLPKEFPVYLWQPFLRHSCFCFPDRESQKKFSTVLNDCIRHLNHDYFKQVSFEAQAFLEAVQFFRQEKGHYGSSEMITGNEIQILSNLVMEELLPSLQTMVLPKMKGKRHDRKRAWFGILEETYHLVQNQVSEGLRTLKDDCKEVAAGLEGTIRSNMDEILTSKNHLAGKIKESISEPMQTCCGESIQPFLASILEELMGPVSSGFSEVRLLFEKEVNEISQNFQETNDIAKLKENVKHLTSLPYDSVKMEPCYLKVDFLQEQLQDLKSRFKFYDIGLVIQMTQNVMQELMGNAVYTFDHLLSLSHHKDAAKVSTAIEKVKLRVLKQYDYDSSTARKKIFQDALVQISLPTLQRTLASTCKPELQKYEQFIFAEHNNVIQVENVYEEILLQTLLDEALKVIKEAAHLKKHNLYEEVHLPCESVSSLSDLKTPSGSAQASPARKPSASLIETLATDTQSNEVFVPEKLAQDGCHEARNKSEENSGTLSSIPTGGREERVDPQLPTVVETSLGGSTESENKVPEEEEKLPVLGGVDEIRRLLTVTIELPPDPPSEKKEQVHETGLLTPQESAETKDKEEERNVEECQTDEMHEPSEEHFPPSTEAADTNTTAISLPPSEESGLLNVARISLPPSEGDYINVTRISLPSSEEGDYINVTRISLPPSEEGDYINVTSVSGEGRYITHPDRSMVCEELGLSPGAESESKISVWYTDVKSDSPDHQSQTKPDAESEKSGQREGDLSPLPHVPIEEKSQVEQHAEIRKHDQEREELPSLQSVPVDDHFQTGHYVEDLRSALPETEVPSLHSVLTEVDSLSFPGCSAEAQESILNIAKLAIASINLPVSPETKETEGSDAEVSVKLDSKGFSSAQGEDLKEASVPLPSAEDAVEGGKDRRGDTGGNCPEPHSEK
uniref:protein Niban n=1 Tax=Podarcis muralis TaxID=64176 RepID=UPI00109F8A7E|nr:protein Niban [Podarcis muralis]